MTEPIKLLNSFKYFKDYPHQQAAVQWLDENLTEHQRSMFSRLFRNVTSGRDSASLLPSPEPSLLQLAMNWTGQYDQMGFRRFNLQLIHNGSVVDTANVRSGALSTQNEPFIRPERDFSGSLQCLPEGIYLIDPLEPLVRRQTPSTWQLSHTTYWTPLERLPEHHVNNRGAFGILVDSAPRFAHISAGCIQPLSESDGRKILTWLSKPLRPLQLICNLNTGYLREHQGTVTHQFNAGPNLSDPPFLSELDLQDMAREYDLDSRMIQVLSQEFMRRMNPVANVDVSGPMIDPISPKRRRDDLSLPHREMMGDRNVLEDPAAGI